MRPETKREVLPMSDALRSVLDAVTDGVAVLDRDRRIVFLNRKARELLDCDERAALGARCSDVLNTTDCENNCPLTRMEQRGERVEGLEMLYRGCAGREVVASTTFQPLLDDDGNVVGSVEIFRDLGELRRLERQLYGRRGLGRLVGKSCAMRHLYELVETAAAATAPMLVVGESGTGKEAVARATHEIGARAAGPFVTVNCAVLAERAHERELFGCASRQIAGARTRFEAAEGGTLFLDDVERLSASAQRQLLAHLDGGVAGVRLVAATSRDIEAAVERGVFDRDLFYTLNAFPIPVAPLRDRAEDIPLLVDHFIRLLNQRSRNRFVDCISPEALDVLCGHDFPGNVRELEHAIEHAHTRCRGKQIRLAHLPPSLTARAAGAEPAEESDESDSVEILERDFMVRVLEENGWRLNAVAEQLGLSRTTLWRKLRRLGIENPRRAS
jgi:PAS domain S-box-containing protein